MADRPNLRLGGLVKHRNALAACFRPHQELRVDRFPDSHVLLARESSEPALISNGRLSGSDFDCDLNLVTCTLDLLFGNERPHIFYINFPDNLADVLLHFSAVESCAEMCDSLNLFSAWPADEGGSSALGLYCPDKWIFCLDTTEFCDIEIVFAGSEDCVSKLKNHS